MKIGAGSVGRVLGSAFLLVGLGVAAQPVAASAAGAVSAAQAVSAAPTRQQPSGPSAVVKHKTRKLAKDPREQAWRSHLVAHPVPAPRATAREASAATERRLRAAAAQQAVQRATVSTCSGPIDADTLISCQNPSNTGTDTYTLTLPAGANVLVFQTMASFGSLPITVTAPDSTTVSCQQTQIDQCATSQSGTYTVAVASNNATYTLEFTALLTESNCPAISLSFASAPVQGTLTAGETGDCYSISAPSGHNLYTAGRTICTASRSAPGPRRRCSGSWTRRARRYARTPSNSGASRPARSPGPRRSGSCWFQPGRTVSSGSSYSGPTQPRAARPGRSRLTATPRARTRSSPRPTTPGAS